MLNPTWEEEFGPRRPNPKRQLQGAQNRALGEVFEKMIDAACEEYRERGLAHIEKTPEPMKATGRLGGGQFRAHFVGQAQPDYKGTLQGGRAVCMEAKTAAGGVIRRDRVTAVQQQALEAHHRLGAAAYVLVCLDFRGFYAVPWAVWRDMKERVGRVSMTEKELAPYGIHTRHGVWDFLGLMEEV